MSQNNNQESQNETTIKYSKNNEQDIQKFISDIVLSNTPLKAEQDILRQKISEPSYILAALQDLVCQINDEKYKILLGSPKTTCVRLVLLKQEADNKYVIDIYNEELYNLVQQMRVKQYEFFNQATEDNLDESTAKKNLLSVYKATVMQDKLADSRIYINNRKKPTERRGI
jgi:hypothetical protein